jgi:hypothetical protein
MPPDQPGQANFYTAQATKGREDPTYLEALEAGESQELAASSVLLTEHFPDWPL